MNSCWLWFIGGYQSSGHVGHFDQNCPNLVRMPWIGFKDEGLWFTRWDPVEGSEPPSESFKGGVSRCVSEREHLVISGEKGLVLLVNGLTWSCSSFSLPKHSLSLGFIRTSTLNHQVWTNQQKPWNKKQLPAPSKGCQMVPKGFQFTIP